MLTLTVYYQLLLPIPDLDAQNLFEARALFEVLLRRAIADLRLKDYRDDALDWFENGECRAWCDLLGYDIGVLFERVEAELDKPLRWVHHKGGQI